MTAADQIVTASKKSLDPRAPSTHKHLGRQRRLMHQIIALGRHLGTQGGAFGFLYALHGSGVLFRQLLGARPASAG